MKRTCETCYGTGVTVSYSALDRIVALLLHAGEDSLARPADFIDGERRLVRRHKGGPLDRFVPSRPLESAGIGDPGSSLHELCTALAGRAPDHLFGYDGIDRAAVMQKLIQVAGLPGDWGVCPACGRKQIDAASTKV